MADTIKDYRGTPGGKALYDKMLKRGPDGTLKTATGEREEEPTKPPGVVNPINPLFAEKGRGPLSSLEAESRFAFKILEYPKDIRSGRFPYWIQFNVLMNQRSQFAEKLSFGEGAASLKQNSDVTGKRVVQAGQLMIALSSAKLQKDAKEANPSNKTESAPVPRPNLQGFFKTQTVHTKQSIILYMPDTLNWSFQNDWDSVNVNEELGKAGLGASAAAAGVDIMKNSQNILKDLLKSPQLAEALGGAGGGKMGQLGLAAAGFAANPGIEVLYKSPTLREFQFEFIFAPRERAEAETALRIIQMFKFHSAPELYGGADLGRYYIPPSQFDIQFYGPGGPLWQLGQIQTQCVLKNVTVNYGQSGKFAVFADGTPTNIQLQLNFQETAFITKEDVEKGF